MGLQGPTGSAGLKGPVGSSSPMDSIIGAQGFQGLQGFQGFQSCQGLQGYQGLQGNYKGNQGLQGSMGLQGSDGEVGLDGIGVQGPRGNQGLQGLDGVQGFYPNLGSMGSQGSLGFFPATGLQGYAGPDGAKPAIVEINGEYRALYCVESPNVKFKDVIDFRARGGETDFVLDPIFVNVCEPESISVVSIVSDNAEWISANVVENRILVSRSMKENEHVCVVVEGTRKGFSGVRFSKKTQKQAEDNDKMWRLR